MVLLRHHDYEKDTVSVLIQGNVYIPCGYPYVIQYGLEATRSFHIPHLQPVALLWGGRRDLEPGDLGDNCSNRLTTNSSNDIVILAKQNIDL